MKNYTLHIPEGVKDYIGPEAALKDKIQEQIKEAFRSYSYDLIETPTFEYLNVFTVGEGEYQQPRLYHLISRQGEMMALRSDMTRAIARVVCTQKSNTSLPQRYGYIASSFRYPARYQGKLHEFTQAGIELIGKNCLEADAEIIKVAIAAIKQAGLKDFSIHIGSSQFLENMLSDLGLSEGVRSQVYEAIERKDGVKLKNILELAQIDEETLKLLLELTQCAGSIELLASIKDRMTSQRAKKALGDLEDLYEIIKEYGVSEHVLFDFSLLSYGKYYTGMMFQIFCEGIGSALAEGGRYDRLLNEFGRDLPAVGVGIDINLLMQRLMQIEPLEEVQTNRSLIVSYANTRKVSIQVGEELRKQGMIIENSFFDSFEEALNYAKEKKIGGILHFIEGASIEIYNVATGQVDVKSVDELM
ncbi:ATP phosphoribosyltransferase regulatory subunit [Cellulosilyticum ruminicola]|uniref:ATP phosphoribosyltransferase regulatory subunit n=1 Tax=Cellulosilyticum ruminicola TaxID=425254 RepID=UPI0006CF2DD7|nr:ATP phosphoribosyltransferase regulatory subunit [Cellulosilyticum ruminicola]